MFRGQNVRMEEKPTGIWFTNVQVRCWYGVLILPSYRDLRGLLSNGNAVIFIVPKPCWFQNVQDTIVLNTYLKFGKETISEGTPLLWIIGWLPHLVFGINANWLFMALRSAALSLTLMRSEVIDHRAKLFRHLPKPPKDYHGAFRDWKPDSFLTSLPAQSTSHWTKFHSHHHLTTIGNKIIFLCHKVPGHNVGMEGWWTDSLVCIKLQYVVTLWSPMCLICIKCTSKKGVNVQWHAILTCTGEGEGLWYLLSVHTYLLVQHWAITLNIWRWNRVGISRWAHTTHALPRVNISLESCCCSWLTTYVSVCTNTQFG